MEPAISSLGLLSGYNSSGSDEEDTTDKAHGTSTTEVNFFSTDPLSSDDDGVVQMKKETTQSPTTSNPPLPSARLPAPLLGRPSAVNPRGVFSCSFREEQEAQLSMLERHVKLSDSNWMKRGRGACLGYQRDGRCRYGTNCKYSHESDLPHTGTGLVHSGTEQSLLREDEGWKHVEGVESREMERGADEKQSQKGKRKKPGLSNTLIPPKKTMRNYKQQLAIERPWTL